MNTKTQENPNTPAATEKERGGEVEKFEPVPLPETNSPLGRILDDAASRGDFKTMHEVCGMMASSNFVPKAFQNKPGDVLVAVDLGRTVGLPAIAALQNIAVINGKPSIYGDGILSIVKANGGRLVENRLLNDNGETIGYECVAIRSGHPDVIQRFTVDDAEKAKLLNKDGPWKQYRSRMLQMRARGFACRDQFADWLNGMISREEAEDYIDVDYSTGEVLARADEPKAYGTRTDEIVGKFGKNAATDAKPEKEKANTETNAAPFDIGKVIKLYEMANTDSDMKGLNEKFYQPNVKTMSKEDRNKLDAVISDAWKRIRAK